MPFMMHSYEAIMSSKAKKYAARMLFQFRTVENGLSNKKRLCEERIILFEGSSAAECYRSAKKRGKREELSYVDGNVEVFFEFIGIVELIELDMRDPDEVWWHFVEKIKPMENIDKLIPRKDQLSAFKKKNERKPGRILVPGRK